LGFAVFGYTFLTVTNSLEIEMMPWNEDTRFRRLPNGVLYRSISPEARALEEARSERSRRLSPKEKAERAERRKAEKRLEDIGSFSYYDLTPKAERENAKAYALVKKEFRGNGIVNFDIERTGTVVTRDNGKRVAGAEFRVFYSVNKADLGLDEEGETEDAVYYIVYRDSEKPGTLRIKYGV
jgi:hypothetical protein